MLHFYYLIDFTSLQSVQSNTVSHNFFCMWYSHLSSFFLILFIIVEAKNKHYNPSIRHLWHSKGSLPWSRSCFECLYRGPGNLQQHDSVTGSQTFKKSLFSSKWGDERVFTMSITTGSLFNWVFFISHLNILWWACSPAGGFLQFFL